MNQDLQAVEAAALQLSAEDRLARIEPLIDTVLRVPSLAPAWFDEIERRLADLDAGRTAPVAAEAVLGDLRALIAGHAKPS